MIERKIQILTILGDPFLIFGGQQLPDIEKNQKIFLGFFGVQGARRNKKMGGRSYDIKFGLIRIL